MTTPHRNRAVRALWLVLALLALALAVLGVMLPGLPTTPFVLLAAYAAARGSAKLDRWLRQHRLFGTLIRDWERQGAVSMRAKRVALLSMVLCGLIMLWVAPRLWMSALGIGFMLLVAIWLWRRPEPCAGAGDSPVAGVETQRSTRLP